MSSNVHDLAIARARREMRRDIAVPAEGGVDYLRAIGIIGAVLVGLVPWALVAIWLVS